MTQRLTALPTEEIILTFKYASELPAGVTLDTPSTQVRVDRGTDPAAAGIAVSAQVMGTDVLVPVAGMLVDTDYHITCTCTTSSPELTLARDCVIRVRDRR